MLAFAQSKAELKSELYKAQEYADTYKSLSITWKEKADALTRRNQELNNSLNELTESLINILPYLTVSEGFPEKYYPNRYNIELYNKVNSNGYQSGDTSISSKYNCAYYPLSNPGKPDSVIILGVIDSTLSRNNSGVVFGSLAVLYDNQIRYTSLRYVQDSKAAKKVESLYEKKILIEKYGEEIGNKIHIGRPWIGMSSGELYEMFGLHDDLNTYENSSGTIYSYTYRRKYETYVITVQNSRVTEILKL